MKSLLMCMVFFHSLLSFEYTLEAKKVGATTHCFIGLPEVMDKHNNGNMVNSCFVDMGTSYLVIDSGPTYLYAQNAYKKMKEIKELPVSYVINTHVHDDHWLGNSYYNELGVKILGSKQFESLVKSEMTRMQKNISKEAYAGTSEVFPNEFVNDKKVLMINDMEVQIKSINKKAHSNSDLFVYIPSISTVFAGDLVFNERIPSLRDGNINTWIQVLDDIKSLDAEYIVGGHGAITNMESTDATYKYLSELKNKVASLIEEGVEIDDALNEATMPYFQNFKLYEMMHRQNIEVAYRMLEWGDE
ncbi:MBL fold metallo-hydrolase [bacterium]|nr:MBL fold metallo-hydrolase [bacterium]MBU1990416.1 MBL fold metallo-hydrolase [bacterium]